MHNGLMILIILCFALMSCNGQNNKVEKKQNLNQTNNQKVKDSYQYLNYENQISDVVRAVFQDSKGDYWFGGQGGAFKLNGDTLSRIDEITNEEGKGITIKDISEDKNEKIWFGHTDGISVTDGKTTINYYESDGLLSNDVWCIAIDMNNHVWIGTIKGVCKFDGIDFQHFDIPEGKIDTTVGVSSKKMIHDILVDSRGRLWFSTNGGVYIKDGDSLRNISEKDGLKSSFVNKVIEDKDGTFWIATSNGLYHYSDEYLKNITKEIISEGKGIGTVIQDFKGNIWFNSNLRDIYSYDGENFKKFEILDKNYSPAPFQIYEDNINRLWFVGFGGAYRYKNNEFINITQNGPW